MTTHAVDVLFYSIIHGIPAIIASSNANAAAYIPQTELFVCLEQVTIFSGSDPVLVTAWAYSCFNCCLMSPDIEPGRLSMKTTSPVMYADVIQWLLIWSCSIIMHSVVNGMNPVFVWAMFTDWILMSAKCALTILFTASMIRSLSHAPDVTRNLSSFKRCKFAIQVSFVWLSSVTSAAHFWYFIALPAIV